MKSADIVLVTSLSGHQIAADPNSPEISGSHGPSFNATITSHLTRLVHLLKQMLSKRGFQETRFGLITHNGEGLWRAPQVHTINGYVRDKRNWAPY